MSDEPTATDNLELIESPDPGPALALIDQVIAATEQRLAHLRGLRKFAEIVLPVIGTAAGNGASLPEAPTGSEDVPPDAPGPESASEDSPPEDESPAPDLGTGGRELGAAGEPEPEDAPRAEPGLTGRERSVLEYVRHHPGLSGTELGEALKVAQPSMSQVLIRLSRKGKIRREKHGSVKLVYPAQAEIAKADAAGAKSGYEREIVAILRERALTLGGLAVRLKRAEHLVAPVLAAMVRRDPPALERYQPNGSAKPMFKVAGT